MTLPLAFALLTILANPATADPLWLPGGPQNLAATTDMEAGTVTLSWDAPAGSVEASTVYVITRNGLAVATVSETSYTEPLPALASNYVVWAVQEGGPPVPSAPVMVRGPCEGPFFVYIDSEIPFVFLSEGFMDCIEDILEHND